MLLQPCFQIHRMLLIKYFSNKNKLTLKKLQHSLLYHLEWVFNLALYCITTVVHLIAVAVSKDPLHKDKHERSKRNQKGFTHTYNIK